MLCTASNKPLGYIKGGELLYQLSDSASEEVLCPMELGSWLVIYHNGAW